MSNDDVVESSGREEMLSVMEDILGAYVLGPEHFADWMVRYVYSAEFLYDTWSPVGVPPEPTGYRMLMKDGETKIYLMGELHPEDHIPVTAFLCLEGLGRPKVLDSRKSLSDLMLRLAQQHPFLIPE